MSGTLGVTIPSKDGIEFLKHPFYQFYALQYKSMLTQRLLTDLHPTVSLNMLLMLYQLSYH